MITSAANKNVKRIILLNRKSAQRRSEDAFVAEGIKMFIEAPESGIREIYISESFEQSLAKDAAMEEVRKKLEKCGYEAVSDEVFAKMSDTRTPQGILCVLKQFHYSLEDMQKSKEASLFLVLEGLQDPGNLGTVMRTGEGAGVTGIIMSKDTVDIYNPKTIRATMGSVYRVPFLYAEDILQTIAEMKTKGIAVYAAHLKGTKYYDECDYRSAAAFLIGNEGNGLTEEAAEAADGYIRIPMKGQLESLNAAVASSLLLYEAARQRRLV